MILRNTGRICELKQADHQEQHELLSAEAFTGSPWNLDDWGLSPLLQRRLQDSLQQGVPDAQTAGLLCLFRQMNHMELLMREGFVDTLVNEVLLATRSKPQSRPNAYAPLEIFHLISDDSSSHQTCSMNLLNIAGIHTVRMEGFLYHGKRYNDSLMSFSIRRMDLLEVYDIAPRNFEFLMKACPELKHLSLLSDHCADDEFKWSEYASPLKKYCPQLSPLEFYDSVPCEKCRF